MKSAVVFGGCGFIGLYYVDKKYNFKYDLDSSFDDWKKINPQDWL